MFALNIVSLKLRKRCIVIEYNFGYLSKKGNETQLVTLLITYAADTLT